MKENLVGIYEKLIDEEKQLILKGMHLYGNEAKGLSIGMLPFFDTVKVIEALCYMMSFLHTETLLNKLIKYHLSDEVELESCNAFGSTLRIIVRFKPNIDEFKFFRDLPEMYVKVGVVPTRDDRIRVELDVRARVRVISRMWICGMKGNIQ